MEEIKYNNLHRISKNELYKINKQLEKDIRNQYIKWDNYYLKHKQSPISPAFITENGGTSIEDVFNRTKLNNILDKYPKYRNITKEELYLKYKELNEFKNLQTFTIKGFNEHKQLFRNRIKEITGLNIRYTKKFSDIYWNAYNILTGHNNNTTDRAFSQTQLEKTLKANGFSKYDSNAIQSYLYNIYAQNKPKTYVELIELISEEYNNMIEEEDELSIDRFFGFR